MRLCTASLNFLRLPLLAFFLFPESNSPPLCELVYDGAGVNRLHNLPCQPAQFKEVEQTLVDCIEVRRQELMEFAMVGGILGREMMEESREKNERMIDLLLRSSK